MPSFLDDENEMVIDLTLQEIANDLFADWVESNLDEGQMYSDYQIALRSNSDYLKGRFNLYYNLTPSDEYYLEFDEEE